MNNMAMSYTWSNVNSDVNGLANTLCYNHKIGDIVVALNDDLIPATLVAARLNLSVLQIKCNKVIDNTEFPVISIAVNSGTGDAPDFPRIIIIVGYFDDNENVKHIVKYYESVGHLVDVVSICASHSTYPKTNYFQHFLPNKTKIIFPWSI